MNIFSTIRATRLQDCVEGITFIVHLRTPGEIKGSAPENIMAVLHFLLDKSFSDIFLVLIITLRVRMLVRIL